jgi:hypothetical protein
MKITLFCSFCLVLLLSGNGLLSAQNIPADSSDSRKVDKVAVFGDLPATTLREHNLSEALKSQSTDWILKCNPGILIRGQAPVYVERRLTKSWSLEAAVGVTFKDFLKEIILKGKALNAKDPNVESLSGLTAKLAARYFPWHHASTDFYISPEVEYVDYRKNVQGVYMGSDGRYANGKLLDQQKYYDIKALAGWQNVNTLENDFSFDWYVGIGLRVGHEDNVGPDQDNASVIKINSVQVISPLFTVGIKVGLGL